MIKFFRRIRQKLLSENKISKYLIYAIGEIILVVIGILIALQINNWNEQRKTKEIVSKYYENLIQNLKNDINLFQRIKETANFRYYSAQYLVELAGSLPYDPAKDENVVYEWKENYIWDQPIPIQYDSVFIGKAFLWTHRVLLPNSNLDPTIEELKSTGNFSKLDKKIKDAINDYHDEWQFGFSDITKEIISQLRLEWQASLREEGVNNSDPYMFGEAMDLIIDKPKRLAMLRKFAMEASWHAMRADLLVENAKSFIELINEEKHD